MARQQGFDFATPEPPPAHVGRIAPLIPTDPNVDPLDVPRLSGQNAAILRLLKSKAEATNVEIAAMGILKHTSRISDLRKLGYTVNARRGHDGLWFYSLGEAT